jgi:hypothetical protein
MSNTKVSIISNAITQLGHKPIITLDNADELVTAAEQAYDMLLPSVLSSGNWRFATQIAQLSKSVEVPPPGTYWSTVYLLPAGYLKNTRIWPQNYDYDIYENGKIYSNWNGSVWMEYMFVPDVARLTPSFVHYFVFEIAAYLALSNAQKPEYFTQLEAKREKQWALASALDAQNRPNFSQVDFPVLSNRYIGGVTGNFNG